MAEDFSSGAIAVEDAPDFSKDAVEAKPDFSEQAVTPSETPPAEKPASKPFPFAPYVGGGEMADVPGGFQGPKLPRMGFTPQADDEQVIRLPGIVPTYIRKGSARKAAAIIANTASSSVEGLIQPETPAIIAAAIAAPEIVIPILTATMGKSGSTDLAEGLVDLEQGRDNEAVNKIGNAVTALMFAAAPALKPGSFAQVPTRAGAIGRAGEAVGRRVAPLIPDSLVPEPVAETLAPRTTEALKSFLPAKVQEGERAGISTEPSTDIETYATLKERFGKLVAAGDWESPEFQATFKALEDLKNKHGGAVPGVPLALEPVAPPVEPVSKPSPEPPVAPAEAPAPKETAAGPAKYTAVGTALYRNGVPLNITSDSVEGAQALADIYNRRASQNIAPTMGLSKAGPGELIRHIRDNLLDRINESQLSEAEKGTLTSEITEKLNHQILSLEIGKQHPGMSEGATKVANRLTAKVSEAVSKANPSEAQKALPEPTPKEPTAPTTQTETGWSVKVRYLDNPAGPLRGTESVWQTDKPKAGDAGIGAFGRYQVVSVGRERPTRSEPRIETVPVPSAVAEAKAQAEVSRVAATEGKRSAKDVKAELVARLEDALSKAGEVSSEKLTIEIPGDGTFTIFNDKKAIQTLLERAKKLKTDTGTSTGKVSVPPVLGHEFIKREARRLESHFKSPWKAWKELETQKKSEGVDIDEKQQRRIRDVQDELANRGNQSISTWEKEAGRLEESVLTLEGKLEELRNKHAANPERWPMSAKRAAHEANRRLEIERPKLAEMEKVLEGLKADKQAALVDLTEPPAEPPIGEGPEGGPAEARIRPAEESFADIFGMAEGDLRDLLESKTEAPKPTPEALEARRPGTFEFPSYDEFRNWMDARYAELDHEGMRLAFAEASTANKIAYIKENRGADAHKKAWLTNLATGSILPTERPPVTRTTPRPMPGITMPTGGVPPAYPQPPPPPPRAPSLHPRFDLTALVQLYRQFGKFPVMNERLKSAYGRFIPSKELVELKGRLLWDTKLAERVLGHEIGHFIDLIVPLIGKGKQFGQRLRLLTDFTGQVWKAKELRADAKSLSRQWRGSFADGDKYRDTAKELIADFMSAMLHDPEWVNQNYPRLYDSFSEFRTAKPGFSTVYREIETWLQGGTIPRELFEQDRAAVKRTFDILSQKPDVSRASIGDKISQSMITLWNRAFQKEGAVRRIGESISEKLETSYMWAAKRMALWSDDYTRTVQPHIDKIADDPVEAHTALLSYSKSVRTIGERRAAGVWIEQHPTESFDMIQHLLNLDSALKSKFQTQLDAIGQGGNLYDFAAQVFREIHDRGERFVNRMGREIDSLDLGVDGEAALIAFNVRGKLLNPGGLTEANANRVITDLRNRLTPDQFTALETAAKNLRGLMFDVQKEMFDAGLISKKTWDNLIAPNTDNYLPYAVLDYFDGRVKAGIMPQKGTAKDIADVGVATQLKVASSYTWLQKQRQVQLLRDIESQIAHGPIPVGDALRNARDIDVVRTKGKNATDDVSRAVYWVDGKPHVVEFPNDAGKLLQHALELPDFYQHLEWLHATSRFTHQVMQVFTTLSPRFLLYRNIIRGFRTAGLKVGYFRAAEQMGPENFKRNIRFAKNYADAAFGAEMLPEVRRMVDLEALPPPHIAAGAVRDLPHMRELLERGALPVFSAKKLSEFAPERQTKLARGWQTVKEPLQKVFTTYEAFEKIYNYQAALEKGLPEETAAAIAARGGIPRPGVSGKWSSAAEVIWPWTRVRTQGIRASVQMVRDPRFGKAFAARFAVFEGLPRIAKVAIGLGLANKAISWVMRKDEDKDDPVLGEVARRVSPYKMALDDVVPFVFYDTRTGKYHPFWEFKAGKDVPAHFEVVSIRIPASEEGQTFGNALYQTLVSIPGIREQLGRPGQGPIEALTAATENIGPQLSPVISTTATLKEMILSGRNPPDPWSGSPSANPRLFDAGGTDRAQAIAGYMMNKSGGPGEVAAILAANVGLLDERARQALSYRLQTDKQPLYEKFPFLATAVSHDNYAQYRDEKTAILAEDQLRARARLVMPPEVAVMYDFYYRNLQRKGKLDAYDSARFGIASEFVNSVWGRLADQDSFYGRAAHAVSKDGSKQAKETLKRDLLSATEGLRISWQEVK